MLRLLLSQLEEETLSIVLYRRKDVYFTFRDRENVLPLARNNLAVRAKDTFAGTDPGKVKLHRGHFQLLYLLDPREIRCQCFW